jgi:hypothetical protein
VGGYLVDLEGRYDTYGLYLDTYERDVFNLIFLRTRLYRKEWESIPISLQERRVLNCVQGVGPGGVSSVQA